MDLSPYLSFNGQCEEAFKFYEKCLGGKTVFMMTWGDSPMAAEAPPGWGKKIMHATFKLGDTTMAGADMPSEQKPHGFSVALGLSDAKEADRIFKTMAEKGTVKVPIQETFWALRFGEVVDQFGTPWLINCEKPQTSPPEGGSKIVAKESK
jgi:PhnB protein